MSYTDFDGEVITPKTFTPVTDRKYVITELCPTVVKSHQRMEVIRVLRESGKPMTSKEIGKLTTGLKTKFENWESCQYHLHNMVKLGHVKLV